MNTDELRQWAAAHGEGPVVDSFDREHGIAAKLLRFRWCGAPALAVGSEASAKTRMDSVLDALAWFLGTAQSSDTSLHLVLGLSSQAGLDASPLTEQLGALTTLLLGVQGGPDIQLWTIDESARVLPVELTPTAFTGQTPTSWAALLLGAANREVTGMAARLVHAVGAASFALYPRLVTHPGREPWQLRLDGVDVGRAGPSSATLKLATTNIAIAGEPRDTWRSVVGTEPRTFSPADEAELVQLIERLAQAWGDPAAPGLVLRHGQPEHGLEAHLLSGRLALTSTSEGPLRLAIPFEDGVIRGAQVPTLWGDVSRPPRYLDALLADRAGRPWAIELKDPAAGGGYGAYLRHGIGQAVLYRHFIASVSALDPYFGRYGLDRAACEAALAFPTPPPAAASRVRRHRALAQLFDIDVITFARPGS